MAPPSPPIRRVLGVERSHQGPFYCPRRVYHSDGSGSEESLNNLPMMATSSSYFMNRSASYQKLYHDHPQGMGPGSQMHHYQLPPIRRYSSHSSHSSSEELLAQVQQQAKYGAARIHIDPRYRDTRPIATSSNNSLNREYILGSNSSISRGGSISGPAGGGRENPAIRVEEYKEDEEEDRENVPRVNVSCPRIEINDDDEEQEEEEEDESGPEMFVDAPAEVEEAQELTKGKGGAGVVMKEADDSSWTDDVEDIPFIDDNNEEVTVECEERERLKRQEAESRVPAVVVSRGGGILSDTRNRKLLASNGVRPSYGRKTVSFDLLLDDDDEDEEDEIKAPKLTMAPGARTPSMSCSAAATGTTMPHQSNISWIINKSKTCCEFFRETSTEAEEGIRRRRAASLACGPGGPTMTEWMGVGGECCGTKCGVCPGPKQRHHSFACDRSSSGDGMGVLLPAAPFSSSSDDDVQQNQRRMTMEGGGGGKGLEGSHSNICKRNDDASDRHQRQGPSSQLSNVVGDDDRDEVDVDDGEEDEEEEDEDMADQSYCIYFDKEGEEEGATTAAMAGVGGLDKLASRHFASDDELQSFDMNEMRLDLTELQSSEETASSSLVSDTNHNHLSHGKNLMHLEPLERERRLFRTYDEVVRSKRVNCKKGELVCPTPPFSASMDNIYEFDSGRGKVRALTKYFDQLEKMRRERRARKAEEEEENAGTGDHSTLHKFIGLGGRQSWCKSQPDLMDPLEHKAKLSDVERRRVLAQLQEWSEFGTKETEEHSYRVSCKSAVKDGSGDDGHDGMAMIVKITPEGTSARKKKKEEQETSPKVDGDDSSSLVIIDPSSLIERFGSRDALPTGLVVQRPATCPHSITSSCAKIQFNNPVTVNYQSSVEETAPATTTTQTTLTTTKEATTAKPSPRSRLFSFLTMRQVKRKKGKSSAMAGGGGGGRISRSETREASA